MFVEWTGCILIMAREREVVSVIVPIVPGVPGVTLSSDSSLCQCPVHSSALNQCSALDKYSLE